VYTQSKNGKLYESLLNEIEKIGRKSFKRKHKKDIEVLLTRFRSNQKHLMKSTTKFFNPQKFISGTSTPNPSTTHSPPRKSLNDSSDEGSEVGSELTSTALIFTQPFQQSESNSHSSEEIRNTVEPLESTNVQTGSTSCSSAVRSPTDFLALDCAMVLKRIEMEMTTTFGGAVLDHQDIEVLMKGFTAELSNALLK
jgi:hypothetical protein